MPVKLFFSIIIPAFNEEGYLPSCLKAVINQSFPKESYEIIVVNNNSTDKTEKLAKKFKAVKVVSESKRGLVMARNKGLSVSKGNIIVNLDADCIVPKNWLEKIEKHFLQTKNLVLLTGPYVPEKGQSNHIDTINNNLSLMFYKIFKKPLGYWGGNVAILKSALKKIGGYNLTNPFHDELTLLHKLDKIGKTIYDPDLNIASSNRRVKGRTWKFILKEVLFLYFINNVYNKVTKKSLSQWETIR
ncbi:glycosyltransferase [Patescibacteria group bacterium]